MLVTEEQEMNKMGFASVQTMGKTAPQLQTATYSAAQKSRKGISQGSRAVTGGQGNQQQTVLLMMQRRYQTGINPKPKTQNIATFTSTYSEACKS